MLLVVVIAVAAGVAMAAIAGARRSSTAYGRFLAWANEAEITVGGCECTTDEEADRVLDQVQAAPFVLSSARFGFANVVVELADGTRPSFLAFQPAVDRDGLIGRVLPHAKVLHGRLPVPSQPDEVSLSFLTAERFGLSVGDELRLLAVDDAGRASSARRTVRIVGIHAAPGEFPSASGPQGGSVLLTPAFAQAAPDVVRAVNDSVLVKLRPGTTRREVDEFIGSLEFSLDVDESSDVTSGIERTVRVETTALQLLGIVVAAVGLVVVGQVLRRQAGADGEDERIALSALGSGRPDAIRVGLLRGAMAGLAGAALGIVVAVLMSPLFPVGIARVADPDVGLHADAVVLAAGATVTTMAVMMLGAAAAVYDRWLDRRRSHARQVIALPPRRPAVLVGLKFSVPGGAGQGEPARVSLVSLVVVVIVLAATAVTLFSFDHLVRRRDLAGATWQAAFLPLHGDDVKPADWPAYIDAAVSVVRDVPGVAAAATTGWASSGAPYEEQLHIHGQPVDTQIFDDDGSIRPAIRRGRAPRALGEVALGAGTLRALGLRIGDDIDLSMAEDGPSVPGHVVGEVVLASPWFISFAPGTGVATVASTFAALGAPEEVASQVIMVRYADGVDQLRTFNAVEEALGSYDAFETSDRHGVVGLGQIRLVPVLLLLGLLALVAAAVAHVLLVSVAGHRRDIAVLRAMGFTSSQSGAAVAVHASVLALAACAIGIPLGVLLGRAAWNRIAEELSVVPRPMAPFAQLALLTVALLVIANAASAVPAARAVRLRPAAALRTD